MKTDKLIRTIQGLIISFILIFLVSFIPWVKNLFLIPLFFYFMLGIALINWTLKSKIEGRLKMVLLLTGFFALSFSFDVLYGVFGIWGFYAINDIFFISSTILSAVGFIITVVINIILLKKKGGRHSHTTLVLPNSL